MRQRSRISCPYAKPIPSSLPLRIAIHPLRLLPHPLHPPFHQLAILPLQLLAPLLREVHLQPLRDHLVLRLLDHLVLAAQLLVAVAQLALGFQLAFCQRRDLCRRRPLRQGERAELRG